MEFPVCFIAVMAVGALLLVGGALFYRRHQARIEAGMNQAKDVADAISDKAEAIRDVIVK